MLERWLARVDVFALWLLGAIAGVVVDLALARSFEHSPVLGNPLRGSHTPGLLDLAGWLVLGATLPATLLAARVRPALEDLTGWALAVTAPLTGTALAWLRGREWRGAWLALLAVLVAFLLPALERRRAVAGWRATWCMSMGLVVLFLVEDPAHGLARYHYPRAVVWWIGVAACGAALVAPLWRAGLRLTAAASTVFWSCAFWSLLANARAVSKFSVGLLSEIWRSSGWYRYLGPPHDAPGLADFVWPSVPALLVLLLALSHGPRALTAVVQVARPWVRAAWERVGTAAERILHASFDAVSALALARAGEVEARERSTRPPPPPGGQSGPP